MSGDELVREERGGVLVLRIDRPGARNALSGALIEALGAALRDAEARDDVRAVVLTGTGDRSFCAGIDLTDMPAGRSSEAFGAFMRLQHGLLTVPVVGAANASALGGGMEMLLGCDLVVAAVGARFGFPEVRRGLFPGGSGTSLGTRIPLAVALELLLTGEPVEAGRALELGLVNRVVEPGEVVPTAVDLAERIAGNAPLGVAAVKELARLCVTDPAAVDARRAHWQRVVFSSEDAREGMAAFAEKRDPVWRGC